MDSSNISFPDPRTAPRDAPMALGGDLSVHTLLKAYSQGIFPWYSEKYPVLWWCPDPRFVLPIEQFRMPKSLKRRIRQLPYQVTADRAFEQVMDGCASAPRPGQKGTWITPEMRKAYCELCEIGYAHSIEIWDQDKLVGGVYGVTLGPLFFGESMFYTQPDASKLALCSLLSHLKAKSYTLIDCQQPTEHMARFGALEWPRNRFLDYLEDALKAPTTPGSWARETFATGKTLDLDLNSHK